MTASPCRFWLILLLVMQQVLSLGLVQFRPACAAELRGQDALELRCWSPSAPGDSAGSQPVATACCAAFGVVASESHRTAAPPMGLASQGSAQFRGCRAGLVLAPGGVGTEGRCAPCCAVVRGAGPAIPAREAREARSAAHGGQPSEDHPGRGPAVIPHPFSLAAAARWRRTHTPPRWPRPDGRAHTTGGAVRAHDLSTPARTRAHPGARVRSPRAGRVDARSH